MLIFNKQDFDLWFYDRELNHFAHRQKFWNKIELIKYLSLQISLWPTFKFIILQRKKEIKILTEIQFAMKLQFSIGQIFPIMSCDFSLSLRALQYRVDTCRFDPMTTYRSQPTQTHQFCDKVDSISSSSVMYVSVVSCLHSLPFAQSCGGILIVIQYTYAIRILPVSLISVCSKRSTSL